MRALFLSCSLALATVFLPLAASAATAREPAAPQRNADTVQVARWGRWGWGGPYRAYRWGYPGYRYGYGRGYGWPGYYGGFYGGYGPGAGFWMW